LGEAHILVDNLLDGIDLYVYRGGSTPVARVQTFKIPNKIKEGRIRIQPVFGQNGDVVISSSDHGIVYVMDASDGSLVQRLNHSVGSGDKRIQALDVSHCFRKTRR
jgi:hypothetical protein